MGQPIDFDAPANVATLDERAEAILSAYELLQVLHEKGVLSLLRGMVGAGDELVGTITAALNTPESIRAIRNLILLTRLLGSIPPDALASLVDTVNAGAQRGKAAHRAPGLLQLLWRLRNKDSRRAAAVALDIFEGFGKSVR